MIGQLLLTFTVLISQSVPAHQLETINCHLILCYTHIHCVVEYLCDITVMFEHMHVSHTYSSVDMCNIPIN